MKTTTGPFAEETRRPMLRYKCRDCGAPAWTACKAKSGEPASVPHKARVRAHLSKRTTDAQAASCATT